MINSIDDYLAEVHRLEVDLKNLFDGISSDHLIQITNLVRNHKALKAQIRERDFRIAYLEARLLRSEGEYK